MQTIDSFDSAYSWVNDEKRFKIFLDNIAHRKITT